jgi:4-hydroxy-2-oxoheptanedioate aldolase
MTKNPAKAALAANKPILGCWLQLFNPVVGEMMAKCGYDLVLIDMEHGLGSVPDAANMMRAVSGTGAASIVRVPGHDPVIIKTLMDQGVDGIMVPMVETPEAARAVVSACRYPPKGVRGLAIGIARGAQYGMDATYVETVDDNMLIICQIDEVMAAARATGKKIGTVPSVGRSWQQLLADGFDLVIPSSDIGILRIFGQDEVAAFKALTGGGATVGGPAKGY